jgi:hypothetical protein
MRKLIAHAVPKCFPSQAVIPQCLASLKTASTKDQGGEIRRAVERSTMTDGREPSKKNAVTSPED